MSITKETVCCISIAERPGNFGAQVFNAVFESMKLDYIYKPFKLAPGHLGEVTAAIRALGIRGCGVSMPHKSPIIEYLDALDPLARKIGAVNTIVNDGGKLTGYNTDCAGAAKALGEIFPMKGKSAHVIGAGGAARAIIVALKESGVAYISVSNRDEEKGREIAKLFGIDYYSAAERKAHKSDLLVNATPVGMAPDTDKMPVPAEEIAGYSALMDVVVSPFHTKFTTEGEKRGLAIVPGYRMALYQAAAQFELYTGKPAPLDLMLEVMKKTVAK